MKKNLGSKLGNIGIGIIIIVFGILMNFYTEPGYGRAAGVITKLKLTEQSILYSKYEVYVSFTAQDGKTYENVPLEAYSRDMEEGGELAIRYQLDDPTKIDINQWDRYAFYVYVVGGVIAVVGIARLFIKDNDKKSS